MKTLAIGARIMLRLSVIVTDSQLLEQLQQAGGLWSIAGDAVSFTTPNVGRAMVEVKAVRVGRSVVSFNSRNSQLKEAVGVEIEVISKEEAERAEEAARLKAEEEARLKAEVEERERQEAEAKRIADEQAEAERQAEASRLAAAQEVAPVEDVAVATDEAPSVAPADEAEPQEADTPAHI